MSARKQQQQEQTNMKTTQIELTPFLAARLLERNPNNRTLSHVRARMLSGAILRGEWIANGSTVVVDADGNLLDGQHRCQAVILADQSIPVVLVEGVASAAFATIDIGKTRSASDMFAIAGEDRSHDLSSAVTTLEMIIQNRPRRERLTFLQRQTFLAEHAELRKSVAIVQGHHYLARSVAAACHYLAAQKYGAEFADKWLHDLNALKFDDPQRVLAKAITNARTAGKRLSDARWACGVVLKAMRASYHKTDIRGIKFADEETFPTL